MLLGEINKQMEISRHLKDKKAFIFDLDGTLINSEPFHAKAIETILKENGINKYDDKAIIKKYHGMSDTNTHKMICAEFDNLSLSLTDFMARKNGILIETFKSLDTAKLRELMTPGMLELLNYLKRKQFPMALVTASEREVTRTLLASAHLEDFFLTIRFNQSTFLGKPNPSPYLSAMRELGLKSCELVIFEDSNTGLQAASATGAAIVKIPEIIHS